MRITRSLADRFHEKYIIQADGCWRWTAAVNGDGYGRIGYGGRGCSMMAHRASWQVHGKEVPDDMELDHLCKNRWCVNPDHLEAVPHKVNVLRGASIATRYSARTHCDAGHPFAGENLILRSDGGRGCRICTRLLGRERMAQWRAANGRKDRAQHLESPA